MNKLTSSNEGLDSRSRKSPFIHKMETAVPGVVCPSYYVLSHANGCPYRCDYCCLQLPLKNVTKPVAFENRGKMVSEVKRFLMKGRPRLLSAGESSDSLALDHLTGLSSDIVPLFARQDAELLFPKDRPHKLLFVSKSTNIQRLLSIEETRNTIVSFSVNAPEVAARFEHGAPPPYERLDAAMACRRAGYEVRLRIDPIIPVPKWREGYSALIERVNSIVRQDEFDGSPLRVTLGTIRHNPGLRECAGTRGRNAAVFDYATSQDGADGRFRLPPAQRTELYSWFKEKLGTGVTVALCKETIGVWQSLELSGTAPQCNCAL